MLVIVGTVVVITLIAGAGTWYLARQSARTGAISQVRSSAVGFERKFPAGITGRPAELKVIRALARLDGANFVLASAVTSGLASHSVVPLAVLERAAEAGSISPSAVRAGSTKSEAWAVAPTQLTGTGPRGGTISGAAVLILTDRIGSSSFSGDFLILAGAVIAFAIVMSLALSRRITRPLRRAVAATERIAEGDLEARVGVHPGDVPELSSLANSIDTMAERLGRMRSAERQFLLSVSHELRTPLTSIRGYAEAIVDGTAIEPARAAAVIGNESRRMERLVGDLLDLAKLDARTFSFHFRTVDVSEVLEEVAEELRPVTDAAELRLLVHPTERPALAHVDPDRLDQVLANLVENAAKYARTTITLGTLSNGAEARLVVEDDGPGIPPDEIGRIFDRHYSADRHARPGRPRGSGLGLAIASELSVAMGAAVFAQSPIGPGGGTRMIVAVPSAPSLPT